jgi:hypothetical protein
MTNNEIDEVETLFLAGCTLAGMLVENDARRLNGESPAYREESFRYLAEDTHAKLAKLKEAK